MVKAKKPKEEKEFTTQAQRFAKYVADMPDAKRLVSVFEDFKTAEKEAKMAIVDVIPFGKHRNHTVENVMQYDANYLRWLAKQSFMDAYPNLLEQIKAMLEE
jgi:uncharacterized protein (DUF3820 family)